MKYKELAELDFKMLCDDYAFKAHNIVERFNTKTEQFRKKDFLKHNKAELRAEYETMIEYLDRFEDYQRAFFKKYTDEKDFSQKKENIEEFLRSSELYFNRANTLTNRLSNAIASKDAKDATIWALAGIVVSVLLFLLSIYMAAEPAKHPVENTKTATGKTVLLKK